MTMTHFEIQNIIMPFINRELNDDELEEFLDHVRTCSECMEELEVYYTLVTSMKQLDEDQELSDDYRQDLIDLLDDSYEQIKNNKKKHLTKQISLFVIIGLIAFTSTYRLGEYVVEDVIHKATTSDFMPEEVDLIGPRDLPEEINEQLVDVYMYLRITNIEGAENMSEYYRDAIWNDMIIQREFGQATNIPEWTVLYY